MIISFYTKGMSVNDMEEHIKKMYDFDVSTSTISRITNALAGEVVSWQNQPLEDQYLIVWMEGIVFKVRDNSKVINKTIYLLAWLWVLIAKGGKEVLDLWLGKNESSSFLMRVLTDLKTRGVEDILITATDNLNGLPRRYEAFSLSRKPRSAWSIKYGIPADTCYGRIKSSLQLI